MPEAVVDPEADRLRREKRIRLLRLVRRKLGLPDPEPIDWPSDPAARVRLARARLRKLIKDSRKRQKPVLKVVPREIGSAEGRSDPRSQIDEGQGTGQGADLSDEPTPGLTAEEIQPPYRAKEKQKPMPADDHLADYKEPDVDRQIAEVRRWNQTLLEE